MCRWPDCDQPCSDDSTLMCRHHAAHCDAVLLDTMTRAAADVVRARHQRTDAPFIERTERPRPRT